MLDKEEKQGWVHKPCSWANKNRNNRLDLFRPMENLSINIGCFNMISKAEHAVTVSLCEQSVTPEHEIILLTDGQKSVSLYLYISIAHVLIDNLKSLLLTLIILSYWNFFILQGAESLAMSGLTQHTCLPILSLYQISDLLPLASAPVIVSMETHLPSSVNSS